jgi:fatty-acyl-CoA synthase
MAEATLAITFVQHGTGVRTDTIDPRALQTHEAKPARDGTELVNCGRAFPEHDVAIVDEQGERLGDRQIGQIVTRGPSVTSGYFEEPELTAQSWKQGPDGQTWLYTGDLGFVVDGEVYVCGRLKDIIIIRGRNFYPSDIEWVVSELPGVRRGNVVAFGVDVEGEEQLVVCAEAFASEAANLTEAIQNAVTAQIGISVHEVKIVPQGSLPRTSSGKPQRRKTKQMFLEGALAITRGAADGAGDSVSA